MIEAYLVWDGGDTITVPPICGKPREDQLQGTVGEKLTELAGRSCYDSLGKGRDSKNYHEHIIEVGHLSVWEHFQFVFKIERVLIKDWMLEELIGRPGITIDKPELDYHYMRFTINPRVILDWYKFNRRDKDSIKINLILEAATYWCSKLLPNIWKNLYLAQPPEICQKWSSLVFPMTEDEKWISLYLVCSRGCSHELVRHGDFTAISQRSTRYVDESESEWVIHPLEEKFFEEGNDNLVDMRKEVHNISVKFYNKMVRLLQDFLIKRGVDKFTARKQARGAARGLLGNSLETQLMFSASVAQWKRMLKLRLHPAADAEIRVLFEKILRELKESRYADSFEGWDTVDSPDGIGKVLAVKD